MKRLFVQIYAIGLLVTGGQVHAASSTSQDVVDAATEFLAAQTASLPGKVEATVMPPLANTPSLATCGAWKASLPQGQRPWGRVIMQMTCIAGKGNDIFVNARVIVHGSYVVMARSVSGGQTINSDDLKLSQGELTALPPDIVTDAAAATGRSTRQALSRAQPLRSSYLLSTVNVRAGQEVRLLAIGNGFSVANSGRALNTAAEGEIARVKLDGGRVISGVVRADGVVEVKE